MSFHQTALATCTKNCKKHLKAQAFPVHSRTNSIPTSWLCAWVHPIGTYTNTGQSQLYASQQKDRMWRGSRRREGIQDAIKTQIFNSHWKDGPYTNQTTVLLFQSNPKVGRTSWSHLRFSHCAKSIQSLRERLSVSPQILRRSRCRPLLRVFCHQHHQCELLVAFYDPGPFSARYKNYFQSLRLFTVWKTLQEVFWN